MPSVGEKLRLERESRNTSIEEMVTATGIGQTYLEALERGEINALPGKAFGKLYIRAYAEVFGFDPQPFVEDYDRERRLDPQDFLAEATAPVPASARPVAAAIARWKETRAPVVVTPGSDVEEIEEVEPVEEVAPVPERVPEPPAAKRRLAPILILGIVVVILVSYFGLRGKGDEPKIVAAAPAPVVATPAAPPPEIPKPVARAAVPASAPVPTSAPSTLSVTEFGLGRRLVNGRIDEEADRFAPGERVNFATRVLGGRRGSVVRHVWLYEGKVEQTITLRIGAADWRTHSNKTLGKAGAWAVEARDASGRVLASASFTCESHGRAEDPH